MGGRDHPASGERLDVDALAQYRGSGLGLASSALKFGSLFVVAGYMSFRAHVNRLGIPSTSSLGGERYLKEAYGLMLTVFLPLFQFLLLIAVVVLLVRLAIARTKARRAVHIISAVRDRALGSMWLPILLLISLIVLTFVVTATVLNQGYDVVLDTILPQQLDYLSRWTFNEIVIAAAASYGVYLSAMNRLAPTAAAWRHHRRLWRLVGWSLLVVFIQMNVVYGAAVKRAWYPRAKVTTNAARGETLCGVLLLENNDDLALWRYVDHRGQILMIPKSTVSSSQVSRLVDLLEVARNALAQPQADALDCNNW